MLFRIVGFHSIFANVAGLLLWGIIAVSAPAPKPD